MIHQEAPQYSRACSKVALSDLAGRPVIDEMLYFFADGLDLLFGDCVAHARSKLNVGRSMALSPALFALGRFLLKRNRAQGYRIFKARALGTMILRPDRLVTTISNHERIN